MERVILIPEILHEIFQQMMPQPYFSAEELFRIPKFSISRSTKAALLNVALTCWAFCEPALDILWWAMDDMTPLFSLIPGYKVLINGEHSTKAICQPIHSADLTTFFYYAKRIKLFCLKEDAGISFSLYIQVLRASDRTCLLPSLKYFGSRVSRPEIIFFLSPSLLGIHIRMEKSPDNQPVPVDVWTFLHSLPNTAPRLISLKLICAIPNASGCLKSISKLSHLKYLYLDNLDSRTLSINADYFVKLDALSQLSRVVVRGSTEFLNKGKEPSLGDLHHIFYALRSMELLCSSMKSIAPVTRLLLPDAFPQLQQLKIFYNAEVDESEKRLWRSFFETLSAITRSSTFHNFSLESSNSSNLTLAMIPEIFKLHLTHCELKVRSTSAEDCRSMVQHWPDLSNLRLSASVSFDALIELAIGGLRLSELKVNLDCQALPDIVDVPPLNHSLSCLILDSDSLRPTDPVQLAMCLDRLFPSLEVFLVPQQDTNSKWKLVQKLQNALSFVRRDQQLRDLARVEDEPLEIME